MKIKTFISTCALVAIHLFSFGQNNVAKVNQVQGFYVFSDCQPLATYEALGEVSTEFSKEISGLDQYQPVRDFLIKKARQMYYKADGIILDFTYKGNVRAVIVKFNETAKNKDQAKPGRYQGIFVYVDSEPIDDTEFRGAVRSTGEFSATDYVSVRDRLIKKCKKTYPESIGIILRLLNGGQDIGDCFTFKNR